MQPGDITDWPVARTWKNPRFRLIDFGRSQYTLGEDDKNFPLLRAAEEWVSAAHVWNFERVWMEPECLSLWCVLCYCFFASLCRQMRFRINELSLQCPVIH